MASKRERPGASGASSGRDARAKRRRRPAPRRSRSSFSASREWAVYQLLDPLLPTGGFAHSQGLEAAARSGLVAGGDERPSALAADDGWDVEAFATEATRNAAATAAPFVEAARRAFEGLARRDQEEEEEEKEDEEEAEGVEDRGKRSKEERDSSRRKQRVKLDDDASVDRESAAAAAASAFSSLDAKMGALLAGNHVASRASAATGAALLRAFLAAHGSGEYDHTPGPDGNRTSDLGNGAPPPAPPLGGAPLVAPEATLALRDVKRGPPAPSERAPRETPRPVREEGSETLHPKPVVLRARRPRLHVAVVFGAVAGALGVDAERAARLFAYVVLRDVLSAATRLNLVGPLEAAEALRRCQAAGERLFARALAEARRDAEAAVRAGADPLEGIVRRAACAAPLADIAQGGHDALESRLFSS